MQRRSARLGPRNLRTGSSVRPVMRLFWLGLVVGLLALPACSNDGMECDSPVLAASTDMKLATSCAPGVEYQGEFFSTGCAFVDPSRFGDRILDDGGETHYTGARAVKGFPPDEVLILLGGERCGGRTLVATAPRFSQKDYDLLASPLPRGSTRRRS